MSEPEEPLRIVVVEDDDDHAELVMFHLQRCAPQAHLTRIEDGAAAIEHLRDVVGEDPVNAVRLVLLDLKLPQVDGIGVLSAVRDDPRLASVPIVMLSTSEAEHDKVAAYMHQVNGYVVKPSGFENYRTLVQSLVEYWCHHNRVARRMP